MSNTIIQVENLGKKYLIKHQQQGSYTALRDVITDKVKSFGKKIISPLNHKQSSTYSTIEEFWALKDISFKVNQGEVIGIIGRNGAGKSTLLKILSRITEPTTGRIRIDGRVASLLEVGTGFHPELTGRENIFLNGAILGMGKAEIKRKFDQIVDFAEIEKFLDTPVKRYSSGMYVRLAFAVAAHLEPEILLVDEVLAVGDAQFQKKCLGKMGAVAGEGRTILFVSHNMTAIKTLCDTAILLKNGKMFSSGNVDKVVNNYSEINNNNVFERAWRKFDEAPGNEQGRLVYAGVSVQEDHDINSINIKTPITFRFIYNNCVSKQTLNFSLVLYSKDDVAILNTASDAHVFSRGIIEGTCRIPDNFLNDEIYKIRLLVVKDRLTPLIDISDLLCFEVNDDTRENGWMGKWEGLVRPHFNWDIRAVS